MTVPPRTRVAAGRTESGATLSKVMAMSDEPYCDVSSSASGLLRDWDDDAHADWDVASNFSTCTAGETGPGGHNVVPPGTIGAEYRMMKEALASGSAAARGTPQRDPYHGRTIEPKCAFPTCRAFIPSSPSMSLVPRSHRATRVRFVHAPLCVRSLREPPHESFNLMVVGEAGLGKTTLLESFFKSFRDDEAAFSLLERKETATESEARRQLADMQVQHNAAEREMQSAIEKAQYKLAQAKQMEIAELDKTMAELSERLKELSAADERRRNELRSLREATRSLRLEMKRAADAGSFGLAAEFQLEAGIMQAECDLVQAKLKQMRRGNDPATMSGTADEDDPYDDDEERRPGHRAINSSTVSVKAFDPFLINVGKHELQITLVDTPGYGESLHTEESFDVICSYVDTLFEKQLRAESSWSPRDAERLRMQDPLVHVCLYFIAPHRLKHIDVAFMRALHRKVNIVPIIAKSDTMTTKEKDEFKMSVREALKREGIEAYGFDLSVLRQMEQQDKQEYMSPWAVIGSTEAYLDAGTTVYLRKYPWGNALSSEPAHSDLPALRNLLMWSGQWHDLKMATRAKYEAWRVARPLSRRSTAAIGHAGTAMAAKARRVRESMGHAGRTVQRTFKSGCDLLGVPPRYGARALAVLLLSLGAVGSPAAVRWATGIDVSLARKLELSRAQVDTLGVEKSR